MRYIATRCGVVRGDGLSHGLFGKLQGMERSGDISDLDSALKYVHTVSEKKTIVYRAIISLREDDAIQKGYNLRGAWEQLIQEKISMIAEKMNIPIERLEWCAATHMDKGHPHTHLLYWDKSQGVRKAWIAPETSNAIRRDLLKHVFAEEFEQLYREKNDARSALDNADDTFFMENFGPLLQMERDEYRQILNELKAADSDLCMGSLPYSKIPDKRYLEIIADICRLCETVPKAGRLSYQLMPEEIKRAIDEITMKILQNNTDCKREFDRYISAAMEIAKMNTSNSDIVQKAGEKAYVQMKAKIGNKILSTVKELNRLSRAHDYQERREQYQRQAVVRLISEVFTLLSSSNEQQQARVELGGDLSKQAKKELAEKLQSRSVGWER